MEEFLGEVTNLRHLTLSVIEITVRLIAPSSVVFRAGQHMKLRINGKEIIAPMAWPPRGDNVELVFLLSKTDQLKEYFSQIKVGDQIPMEGPAGDFFIIDPRRDILAMAHNTGIAPFASIVPELLLAGYSNKFKLLFEVNSEEDVFYFERFQALSTKYPNFSFVPMVVRPHAHWPGEVGSVTIYIQVSAEYLSSYETYICGDGDFIKQCSEQWKKSVPQASKPITCQIG